MFNLKKIKEIAKVKNQLLHRKGKQTWKWPKWPFWTHVVHTKSECAFLMSIKFGKIIVWLLRSGRPNNSDGNVNEKDKVGH